ncbi:hypothetical protein QT505_22495, partial [Xanthomonas citri pv. citri]
GHLSASHARRRRQKDGAHRDDIVSSTIIVDGLQPGNASFQAFFVDAARCAQTARHPFAPGATIAFCLQESR